MNSRFKKFGFGSKRNSTSNAPTLQQQAPPTSTTAQPPGRPQPLSTPTSTNSLPINPGGPRPPSYTSNYPPGGPQAPVPSVSPRPAQTPRTPPTQIHGGPPPINTMAGNNYRPHAGYQGGAPPALAGPPQYANPSHGQAPHGSMAAAQYASRGAAVEVEGAGRSKAQLIVGIDFVSSATHLCGEPTYTLSRALLFQESLLRSLREQRQRRI